ncbi:MAG: aminoacyl-tRNA hydrolase [Thermomicrobiales bacterium]|nr:aminoacyl-tRNA hydrolase [Thermomicrobiales bacterium]
MVKIIIGLGNPGKEYAATRHNIGFMVIDRLRRELHATETRKRFRAEIAEALVGGEKLVLVKPQTYMNLSGISAREVAHWYKATLAEILVVVDDIELPFGASRMRAGGSAGGHNGLKSIAVELGSDQYPRLRLGVGRGAGDARRQVLSRFSQEEEQELPEIIATGADCVLLWRAEGIQLAMNRCNRRPEPPTTPPPVTTAAPAGTPS